MSGASPAPTMTWSEPDGGSAWRCYPVGLLLVNVYLLGLYTFVPLKVLPGPPIPGFLAGAAGWMLLLKNVDRLRWPALWPLMLYATIVVLGTLIAPDAVAYFPERAKSLIYLVYSLGGALGFLLELTRWPRRDVSRLFLIWLLVILGGVVLELYAGLDRVSDAFRQRVFGGRSEYSEVGRDLVLFGRERPKFFTSEPSDVAKFLMISATVWLALSERRRYGVFAALVILGLFLVKSPILLLALGTGGLVFLYLEPGGASRFVHRMTASRLLGLATAALVSVALLALALQTVFATRVQRVLAGADVSVLRRVFSPIYVTREVVSRYPVRGIGVGGEPAVVDVYLDAYASLGMEFSAVAGTYTLKMFNYLWQHWIYLGIGFGLPAFLLIVLFAYRVGVRHGLFCLAAIAVVSQSLGGYVGIRAWSYTMLIFAIGTLAPAVRRVTRPAPRRAIEGAPAGTTAVASTGGG